MNTTSAQMTMNNQHRIALAYMRVLAVILKAGLVLALLWATSAFAGVSIAIDPVAIARTIQQATQSTPAPVYRSKPVTTSPAQKKRSKSRSSATPSPEPSIAAGPSLGEFGRSAKYRSSQSPTASGTGFFVSENGFLLTNYHVIRNAEKILILQGDRELTAKTIVIDPNNDLAVLKVDSFSTPIPLGNVHNVALGESVMTIGFPNVPLQGRSPKLTKGEVNSLCGLQDDPRIFQTSVQLQPGNSGGPLLDEFGNAIAITEATLNPFLTLKAAGSIPQGVNYAVKISYAQLLLDTVPDLRNQLPPPVAVKHDSAEVVSNALKSTVLILVWARNNSRT
jgi:S1-C subfamily serine protease